MKFRVRNIDGSKPDFEKLVKEDWLFGVATIRQFLLAENGKLYVQSEGSRRAFPCPPNRFKVIAKMKNLENLTFGEVLAARRAELGMSPIQVAMRSGKLTSTYYMKFERDEVEVISEMTLDAICTALNIDKDILLAKVTIP